MVFENISCPSWRSNRVYPVLRRFRREDPENNEPTEETYSNPGMDAFLKNIPEDCMVGKFDIEKIDCKKYRKNIHHDKRGLFMTMITNYKSSLFGVTLKATIVWIVIMLIGELMVGIANKYSDPEDDSYFFSRIVNRIKKNKKEFRSFEDNMKKALTILLGFFVTQNIRRWWNQTSRIPYLTDLAIACNAIFQHGMKTMSFGLWSFYLWASLS